MIRGFDPTVFRDSVFEAPAFHDQKWHELAKFPSLLVTNRAPSAAVRDANILDKGKVMIFPLREIYDEHKSLAGFLSDLVAALRNEDAIASLDSLDRTKLQRSWGSLGKYFKAEPEFLGFGVDLKLAIGDLLAHKGTRLRL